MTQTPVLAIKATNIELTPAVAAAIDKRFGALAKFVRPKEDQEVRMQVEVGRKNKARSKADDLFFAELNVLVGGQRHRATATARDLYDAIDEAKAEMTAHLSRAHERAKDERRKGGRAVKEVVRSAPESAPAAVMPRAAKPAAKKVAKKKPAPVAAKKPAAKKVSPRSRVHGTKNTRGAGNRPPQMKPAGKRK